jgi:DNA-binding HxlR family transcriptional regulator
VLTHTLPAVERDGLITRTICAEVPARPEYELNDLGGTRQEPIAAVPYWAQAHLPATVMGHQRYDGVTRPSAAP